MSRRRDGEERAPLKILYEKSAIAGKSTYRFNLNKEDGYPEPSIFIQRFAKRTTGFGFPPWELDAVIENLQRVREAYMTWKERGFI